MTIAAGTVVVVSAFEEADRLPATLAALRAAFPDGRLLVADDASADGTAAAGRAGGAEVVTAPRHLGKGGATTLAVARVLALAEAPPPISGQRALSAAALRAAVPCAPRFGMEVGMTIDVARAGLRVRELELDRAHRATGRTLRGFAHRARQLADFAAVYASRR